MTSTKMYLMKAQKSCFNIFILFALANTVSASISNGQPSIKEIFLNLKFKGQNIENIFIEIEQKTDFSFSYRKKFISGMKVGNTSFDNVSLAMILGNLSKEFNLKFRRIDENIFISAKKKHELPITEYFSKKHEDITVSGTVTTTDNIPLIGVNIKVKGINIGTITDFEGKYKLKVPEESVLIFTYIGFLQQEVSPNGRSIIDIIMDEEVAILSEFIITTYGIPVERGAITGAVSTIKGEEFENLPLQSFDKALQGRVSGVQINTVSGQPGGAVDFKIRGIGSVNASNSPLIIIDGVQINVGGVSNINSSNVLTTLSTNDIASIEILKDAASTAIYGAQGANGVVVVMTKNGDKNEFTFSTQHGITRPVNLYEMLTSRELAQLRIEALTNAGKNPTNNFATHGNPEDVSLTNTNWIDEVFRTGYTESYDLTFSGGHKKSRYFISGSYNKQDGTIINTDWERYTFRFNLTAKSIEKLTIKSRISLSFQEINGTFDGQFTSTNPIFLALAALPSIPITNLDGVYTNYGSLSNTGFPHPVQSIQEIVRNSEVFQTVSSFLATYEIMPSLSFSAFAGLSLAISKNTSRFPQTLPLFSGSGGQTFRGEDNRVNFNNYATINFKENFNDRHQLTIVAGGESKTTKLESLSLNVSDFFAPSFSLIGSASEADSWNETFTRSERVGVFGKIAYTYDERYLVDFSLRRDGSSRFSPGKRFGTFYGGAIAWRLTEEKFFEQLNIISDLKLRVSSGVTGNSEIGDFQFIQVYVTDTDRRNNYQERQSIQLNRPSGLPFGWEESVQTNIGLDFTLFDGRIHGLLDFWRKDNRDLIFAKSLPADGGFYSVTTNVGEVRNQGIDLEFNSVNIDHNGLKWSSKFNLTLQKNELMKLPDGAERIGNDLIVGQPLDFIFGVEYAGVNPTTGRPAWLDKNGNITYQPQQQDMKVIGDFFPDYFGGFSNIITYKGLSLDIFFQFQGGLDNFTSDLSSYETSGSSTFFNQRKSQLRRWQNPGDITPVPRPYDGGQESGGLDQNIFSTKLISDGSYIRLKQVTLGYDIPEKLLKPIRIKKAQLFVQGINLATYTKSQSIDPETVTGSTTQYRNASDRQVYAVFPTGEIWTGGLTITF